jgi:uncharacterized damage-inducible protein DinB
MAEMECPQPQPDMLATDERESLRGWLDFQRATLVWKVAGVSDEQLNHSIVESGTTLGWLIKHCTHAELHWFREVFLDTAPDWPYPDPNPGYILCGDETLQGLIDTYQRVCDEHRRIEREATSLDQISRGAHESEHATLRWILQHLIEETARHNGHADIAREIADGTTGY